MNPTVEYCRFYKQFPESHAIEDCHTVRVIPVDFDKMNLEGGLIIVKRTDRTADKLMNGPTI